jgi:hypothetical protein
MRTSFATTIEEDIQNKFKEACKKQDIKMNEALETMMLMVIEGTMKFRKKTSIEVEEKK